MMSDYRYFAGEVMAEPSRQVLPVSTQVGRRDQRVLRFTGFISAILPWCRAMRHDLNVEGTHAQDSPQLTDRHREGLRRCRQVALFRRSPEPRLLIRQSLKIPCMASSLRRKRSSLRSFAAIRAKDFVNNRHE